jgi:branched-chain amino acid transport system ATP-binding protein
MLTPLLQVSGLTFGYGGEPLLRDISLECRASRIYGLYGNNGSGKTTLFNLICGFLKYRVGEIRYYEELPPSQDPLVICSFGGGVTRTFQVPVLVDAFTVYENMMLAFRTPREKISTILDFRRAGANADSEFESKVRGYLEEFELSEIRDAPVATLSYGRRRIVANLIALLNDSRIVLFDEPFANLHTRQTDLLKHAMKREAHDGGRCMLVIEHSPHHLAGDFIDSLFCLGRTLTTYDSDGGANVMAHKLHSFIYGRE